MQFINGVLAEYADVSDKENNEQVAGLLERCFVRMNAADGKELSLIARYVSALRPREMTGSESACAEKDVGCRLVK